MLYYIIFDNAAGSGHKPDWRYLTPDTGNGHLHVPYCRREDGALQATEADADAIIARLKRLGHPHNFERLAA